MSRYRVGDVLLRRHMAMAAYRVRKCPPREKDAQARECLDAIRQYLGMPRARVDTRER